MSEIPANRAPFRTLWASVAAGGLVYDADEALALGSPLAEQTAAAGGKRLGTLEERSVPDRRELRTRREALGAETIRFMAPTIRCLHTLQGVRAPAETTQIDPNSVRRHVESKPKDALPLVEKRLATRALGFMCGCVPRSPGEELGGAGNVSLAQKRSINSPPSESRGKGGVKGWRTRSGPRSS